MLFFDILQVSSSKEHKNPWKFHGPRWPTGYELSRSLPWFSNIKQNFTLRKALSFNKLLEISLKYRITPFLTFKSSFFLFLNYNNEPASRVRSSRIWYLWNFLKYLEPYSQVPDWVVRLRNTSLPSTPQKLQESP